MNETKKVFFTINIYCLIIVTLLITLFFTSCGFAYKKHITGNYYLIAVHTKEQVTLSYSLGSGDFVGKAPGRILEYGFNDSILVAKTILNNQVVSYYIINMKKDFGTANEEDFRIGPITESDYIQTWKSDLDIQFKRIEN